MRPLRASPFPRWSPAAAAGRLLLSLLALALLGAAFVYSLRPIDPRSVRNQVAQVQTSLAGVRRLELHLPPDLAQHVRFSAGPVLAKPAQGGSVVGKPVFAARLSGARPGALTLRRRPGDAATRLDLSRALNDLPSFIQIGWSSLTGGLPDTLSLELPPGVPTSLWLSHTADDAALDLRRLDLENLNFTSDSGDLSATLPERGAPRIKVSTNTGDLDLTLPPGQVNANLTLGSSLGKLKLRVPPGAQVQLDLRLGDQNPADTSQVRLPATFRFVRLIGAEGQVRRYVQVGRPGGPRLNATLSLDSGALSVQTTSSTQISSGETP